MESDFQNSRDSIARLEKQAFPLFHIRFCVSGIKITIKLFLYVYSGEMRNMSGEIWNLTRALNQDTIFIKYLNLHIQILTLLVIREECIVKNYQ